MMTCEDARRGLARAADGERHADVNSHLASCASCRGAADEQAEVATLLRTRPPLPVLPGFSARVRARLDREDAGTILDLADWRIWGGAVAPLAAALMLVAWLGVGIGPANGTASAGEALASWSQPAADSEAAILLQPGASADVLLESLLADIVPRVPGEGDVR